jgi:Gpi18-like mannosyltransferase
MIFSVFFAWRTLLFVGAYVAQHTVQYLGFFPYHEILTDYKFPEWVSAFANFDGVHYLLISQQGYSQYEQAYFPLYPLLTSLLSLVTKNVLLSGLIISNVSFLIGLYVLKMLHARLFPKYKNEFVWLILFILSFPTAFFFGAIYTEGLFFLLCISSLYFLDSKKYTYAMIAATLASLTRLIGVFLIIPFVFHFISINRLSDWKKTIPELRSHFFLLISPLGGFLAYCGYLWITVKDPLFFFHAQPIFGANRSTHLITLPQVYFRYIKIFITAAHDFRWFVSLFEVVTFTFVFVVLLFDFISLLKTKGGKMTLGISIFSLINIILPTLTGTFSSIPRYALFSLSLFFVLAHMKSAWKKYALFFIFVTLHIALLALFIQGYFIG